MEPGDSKYVDNGQNVTSKSPLYDLTYVGNTHIVIHNVYDTSCLCTL